MSVTKQQAPLKFLFSFNENLNLCWWFENLVYVLDLIVCAVGQPSRTIVVVI